MLAGAPAALVISEFVASNNAGLRDEDGTASDWLEIFNPTSEPVDLSGWALTDDAKDLDKWVFPAVTLGPHEFLVVFASDMDRRVPGAPLHTNFRLSTEGEFLGLVAPGGIVVDAYAPAFPAQKANIGYGRPFTLTHFVGPGAAAEYLVPVDGSLGTSWTGPDFVPDAAWLHGQSGLGYGLVRSGFHVTVVQAAVDVVDMTAAYGVLDDPGLQFARFEGVSPTVNFLDTGPSSHFDGDLPFPGLGIGEDQSNFVMEAVGRVTIPAAGPWTFGVNSDDGFELVLEHDGYALRASFWGQRAPDDTLAVFDIPQAGDWNIRLVSFEHQGWASTELFAAPGVRGGFDGAFRLVGDVAGGGLAATTSILEDGVVGTDVSGAMAGVGSSLYARLPFEVEDPAAFDALALRMFYDDGFIVYLNGVEVARRNAPEGAGWDAAATGSRDGAQVLQPETFSLTDRRDLIRAGTNVLAVHGLNASAGDGDFLVLPELIGWRLHADQARYFQEPTPGGFNGTAYLGSVADVTASVPRGFYEAPFSVTLSSETPGATIRYTRDGSTPSASNGVVYDGTPIAIDGTTVLRAAAFLDGYLAPRVVSFTYLFLDDVIHQSPDGKAPAGWPASWGNNVVDYGMDPNVLALYGEQAIKDALRDIPSISITTDLANLFDPVRGIYANPFGKGDAWERPASVELLDPSGQAGFQINAGLRIRGGYSRSHGNPKHAFRLFLRGEYDGELEFPLFGEEGVSTFHKVDLRTDQNYSWSFHGDPNHTAVRDVFSRDTQRDLGQPYTRSRYYHLYIDGVYWGMFQTQERAEANYAESYFGGDADDYDVVKVENYSYEIYATDGNLDAWRRLYEAATAGFETAEAYWRVQGKNVDGSDNPAYEVLLDVDNLIDYMQVILYTGNFDAPISAFLGDQAPNNFYAIRSRTGREGFRFFAHDNEHTLFDPYVDRNGPYPAGQEFRHFNPQWLHQQLMANPEYRLRFADHVQRNFFHDGAMTPARSIARFEARADEIRAAILGESARWGDSMTEPPRNRADWEGAIRYVIEDFLPIRTGIVVDQFRANGLLPSLAAPRFLVGGMERRGGQIPAGSVLHFGAVAPLVYYTLDGSDPRLPGGGISPSAIAYQPGVSTGPEISATTTVTARAYEGGVWSPVDVATFRVGDPASRENLIVTELNYNPLPSDPTRGETDPDNNAYEFIELRNVGPRDIDLTGVRFSAGITFSFTGSDVTTLAPGAYVLVVKSPEAMRARYGDLANIAGSYGTTNFSNGGEAVTLLDAAGGIIFHLEYDDDAAGGWPTSPDGKGTTLVPIDPRGDLTVASNWRASFEIHGTPGRASNTAPTLSVPPEAAGDEDLSIGPLIVTVGDLETALDALVVEVSTDRPDLFPAGSIVLAGSEVERQITLTPAEDLSGEAIVTVVVRDGEGVGTTRTFPVVVRPVNDAPVARLDDPFLTDEDVPIEFPPSRLLGNDADADGDALSVVITRQPEHGTLTANADGTFTYRPEEDFEGEDSFEYRASDGTAESEAVTVGITVLAVNDAPEALEDEPLSVDEDGTLDFASSRLLDNDSDADGDALSVLITRQPSHGTLTTNADGTFTYRPAEDFAGEDSFEYRASDGEAESEPITVNITVRPVDDAPVLQPIEPVTMNEGQTIAFHVQADDVDTPVGRLRYRLGDGAPAGMTIDELTGRIQFSAPDGPATVRVDVIVSDADYPEATGVREAVFEVANVAPVVASIADRAATAGIPVRIGGSFLDLGGDTWTATVDYGAGAGPEPLALAADKSFALEQVYARPGTYEVVVTLRDDDGGEGQARFRVTVAAMPDRRAPRVIGQPKLVMHRGRVAAIVLRFDEPMRRARALKKGAYTLISAGADGRLGTRDDRRIALRSVRLDRTGRILTLTPRRPLSRSVAHRLRINGTGRYLALTDLAGNRLDGNADRARRPGPDYVRVIGRAR